MTFKKLGIGVVIFAALIIIFSIQEIMVAKLTIQNETIFLEKKEMKNAQVESEMSKTNFFRVFKRNYIVSGIRHMFYGLLFIFSGVGLIKKKRWGVIIFLSTWMIIFLFSIYFVIQRQSYKYMLILPLLMLILSFLYLNRAKKNQL